MENYLGILGISHLVFYLAPKLSKIYRSLVEGGLTLPSNNFASWRKAEREIADWLFIHLVGFGAPLVLAGILWRQDKLPIGFWLYVLSCIAAYSLIGFVIIKARAKKHKFLGEILEYMYKNKWTPTLIAGARVFNLWLLFIMLLNLE